MGVNCKTISGPFIFKLEALEGRRKMYQIYHAVAVTTAATHSYVGFGNNKSWVHLSGWQLASQIYKQLCNCLQALIAVSQRDSPVCE